MKMIQGIRNTWNALATVWSGQHVRDPGLARTLGFAAPTAAGVSITEDTAMTLSAVYCAVGFYARTAGSLPIHVYQQDGESKTKAAKNPAYRLLHDRPNPWMTAYSFQETMMHWKMLWGNAYAEIVWDGAGRVSQLWPIEPWRVRPEVDRDLEGNPTGRLKFRIDGQHFIDQDDMLHFKGLGNGIEGKSVIGWARESLGMTGAAEQFGATFFGRAARPSGVLQHPNRLSEPAAKRLKAAFQAAEGGPANAGGTMILEEGMEWKQTTIPPDDAQFLETRKFQIEEVARWWNLPPHVLKHLQNATFSNIEHQGQELVTYSIMPHLVAHEQEINAKLLEPPAVYAKYATNALLRGDSAARSNYYRTMNAFGAMSINEVRELEELNPIEGGDRYFVPLNMVPLDKVDDEPPPPPKADGSFPPNNPPPSADDPPTEGQGKPPGLSIDLRPAFRELLADATRRLLVKEANAAKRAALKPDGFFAWLDEFYTGHEATAVEVYSPAAKALGLWMKRPIDAAALASAHVAASRESLLSASDHQPAEFPAAVAMALADVEGRAEKLWSLIDHAS